MTTSNTTTISEERGLDLLSTWRASWKLLVLAFVVAGVLGYGVALLIPPTFISRTVLIPPQQQQSGAAAALGSLGALAGLAGGSALKSPLDQYVSLMQSETVVDRLIDQFDLMNVYETTYRMDARKKLSVRTVISAGKKDGLITVEVEDQAPVRAAKMAEAYVEGLRYMLSKLAVTEAQQRRLFFEQKLSDTKQDLAKAQSALQDSGFTAAALRTEPRAAAEEYARLRAAVVSGEVRLQTLRRSMTDDAPEVQQQRSMVGALRSQLSRIEGAAQPVLDRVGGPDYVGKYREFKYQETLFEMYARQFELARVDESREGAMVQVVDAAKAPEKRSKPKRSVIAVMAAIAGALLACGYILWRRPVLTA